jgi:hypothetical protein
VTAKGADAVQRIHPTSGRVTASVHTGHGPLDPGIAGGALWVPAGDGTLTPIDLRSGRRTDVSRWPAGIFVAQPAAGSMWLLDYGGTLAWRLAAR